MNMNNKKLYTILGSIQGAGIGASMGGFAGSRTLKSWHHYTPKEKKRYAKGMIIGGGIGAVGGGLLGARYGKQTDGYARHGNAKFWENFKKTYQENERSGDRSGANKKWDEFFRNYKNRHSTHADTQNNPFNGHFNNAKTKAEAKGMFHSLVRKHHPDKGGTLENAQHVNNAWNGFKNSSEYEKLARLVSKLRELFV